MTVGRITRAHGVRGEVAVLPLSEVASRFEPGSRLIAGEARDRCLTVGSARPHRSRLLVAFEEVTDRDDAESLRGEYLFVPAASSPRPPEESFWPHELVGCEVRTEEGRKLGNLSEVIPGRENDIWVARRGEAEVLIPALKDVVTSVDLEARRIVVRDIAGLTAR